MRRIVYYSRAIRAERSFSIVDSSNGVFRLKIPSRNHSFRSSYFFRFVVDNLVTVQIQTIFLPFYFHALHPSTYFRQFQRWRSTTKYEISIQLNHFDRAIWKSHLFCTIQYWSVFCLSVLKWEMFWYQFFPHKIFQKTHLNLWDSC